MTDAPETIWAAPPWSDEAWEGGAGEWDVSKNWSCDFKVEYTRTDIADAREVTQIEGVKDLADTVIKHEARIAELEAALSVMVNHEVDYMGINNLGEPEEQHRIKQARAALKETK
jgi:hypothetical protein